jgi:large subunit ribosomal protein L15
MPLKRRLPKRGFHHEKRHPIQVINVSALEVFDTGSTVDPEELLKAGLASASCGRIKVLGKGEVTKSLTVRAHFFSGSARQKIEAAGGKTEVL